jgi:tetratricopeptide (TPR) repeat protein
MAKLKILKENQKFTGSYAITVLFLMELALSLSHNIYGQKFPKDIDNQTLVLARETDQVKGQETGAVIILKDYQLIIDKKDRAKTIIRILGKIFNKQAINDYSQIPIVFNSYYEDAVLDFARVIYSDGSKRDISGDAVQIKTLPDFHEGSQYTDNRYLSFSLSGLEPGAAFEYQATISQKIPIIEGEWFDNHWFAGMLRNMSPPYEPRIDPVLTSQFTLRVPSGREFQYNFTVGSYEPVKTILKDQDEYKWILKNLPAIHSEALMPDFGSLSPTLIISTLKDWSQLNRWAFDILMSKIEVSPEIKDLSLKLTQNATTNDEKTRSVANYIQNSIQYVYADLDRGGYTPHMAGEVLKSRYGDCKDQTILLISMLKAIGIKAYPALISPYPYEEFMQIPTIYFAHLITYIPQSDKDIWLDMTSPVTPYPLLAFPDQNRTAFVITETGGRLIKTPASSAEDNTSGFNLVTSFEKETCRIRITISASGAQSDALKQIFIQADPDDQKQYLGRLILSSIDKAVIDSVQINDVHSPDQNFQATIKYHIDSIFKKEQHAFNFGSHAMIPLTFLANADEHLFPAKRYNDIRGTFAYTVSGSEEYVQPDKDFMPYLIPAPDSMNGEYFDFRRNFNRAGNTIMVNWTLRVRQLTIPKEQYQSYISSFKKLKEIAMWNITYFHPSALWEDVVRNDTPQGILTFCNNTLKQDPGNSLLLMFKGLVFCEMQMPDSSLNVFSDIIKAESDNKYAHLWMALPLISLKKNDAAMAHLDEALRLDSDFKEAYFIRASLMQGIGKPAKALQDYEKYINIDGNNKQVWLNKGYLLHQQGRGMEAIVAFKKAVSIDPNDAWAHSGLAQSYYDVNNYEEAAKSYQDAIKMAPTISSNYGNLGWVYYILNNDQKCKEYSLKAIQLDPQAYYARYNLALAYLRSGYYEEALKHYSELSRDRGIPLKERVAAFNDLRTLQSKGIRVAEVDFILKKCFSDLR